MFDCGRVVKGGGTNFINLRDAGDWVEVARRYEEEGADELCLPRHHVQARDIMLDVVRYAFRSSSVPRFYSGGGILLHLA